MTSVVQPGTARGCVPSSRSILITPTVGSTGNVVETLVSFRQNIWHRAVRQQVAPVESEIDLSPRAGDTRGNHRSRQPRQLRSGHPGNSSVWAASEASEYVGPEWRVRCMKYHFVDRRREPARRISSITGGSNGKAEIAASQTQWSAFHRIKPVRAPRVDRAYLWNRAHPVGLPSGGPVGGSRSAFATPARNSAACIKTAVIKMSKLRISTCGVAANLSVIRGQFEAVHHHGPIALRRSPVPTSTVCVVIRTIATFHRCQDRGNISGRKHRQRNKSNQTAARSRTRPSGEM